MADSNGNFENRLVNHITGQVDKFIKNVMREEDI